MPTANCSPNFWPTQKISSSRRIFVAHSRASPVASQRTFRRSGPGDQGGETGPDEKESDHTVDAGAGGYYADGECLAVMAHYEDPLVGHPGKGLRHRHDLQYLLETGDGDVGEPAEGP